MESRETRDSDNREPAQDTSHLAAKDVGRKKSPKKKLVVILVVVVVVVAAVAAGFYFYKVNVLDPQAKKDETAKNAATPTPTPKLLNPQEQMTKTVTDGVDKELAELKKDDGHEATIKNSTQAAISVGSNLDEYTKDLKD